jgi:hypothetical protein
MPGCNLGAPPRHVPLLVRSLVLFGGFANQFGWLFFGFGLIFPLALWGQKNVPTAAYLVSLIFPLIGAILIANGLRMGIKANRLLAYGKTAAGKLTSKVGTNVQINEKTVYKLTFEFTAEDGYSYEVIAKSHTPEKLEDEAQEPLLYDADDPNYAVMLDSLPGSPRVDERGNIRTASPVQALLSLVLPLVTIIGHGTYACMRFFPH